MSLHRKTYGTPTIYSKGNSLTSFCVFLTLCSKYKVDCACLKGNQECPVLKHNQEPTENLVIVSRRRGSRKEKDVTREEGQNQNIVLEGEGKSKGVGDGKQRKLSPLRLSISNNQVGSVSLWSSYQKHLDQNFLTACKKKTLFLDSTWSTWTGTVTACICLVFLLCEMVGACVYHFATLCNCMSSWVPSFSHHPSQLFLLRSKFILL